MKNDTHSGERSFRPLISTKEAVLITLFAMTSAARADQPPATRVAKVSLTGLDMSTPEGAREGSARIKTTVKRLCFQLTDSRKIDDQALYNQCLVETLADAVRRINASTVATPEK
jgi:UrcA family protein